MPIDTAGKLFYISITGLKTKWGLSFLLFWRHAIPSKIQGEKALGLISLDLKYVKPYHHTLSVWKDKEAMMLYRRSGPHLKAMKIFKKIATGKLYGYESTSAPTWNEAVNIWNEKAREV
jgi:hypothetical protein